MAGRSRPRASWRARRRCLVQEAGLVRQPDAVVVRRAPDPRGGDGDAQLARHLVGRALGNAGSPVTSKAIWKPSRSSAASSGGGERLEVRRRSPTPTAPAGCCRRRARSGRAPSAGRPPPPRGRWSAGRATSRRTWSRPRRRPPARRAGCPRARPRGGSAARLQVVPDEVLGERPVGAVAAHRGLPHGGGCRSCPAGRCPRRRSPGSRRDLQSGPISAMRSPVTSTSVPGAPVGGVDRQHGAAPQDYRS